MCIATLFCGHHWGCNTKYFVFGRGVGVILEKRRHDIKTAHHTACCHWICWLAQTRGNRGALAEPFVILTKRLFLTLWHIMLQSSRHGNNFMSGRVYLQHPCKLSFFNKSTLSQLLHKHICHLWRWSTFFGNNYFFALWSDIIWFCILSLQM